MEKLKTENGYTDYPEGIEKVYAAADSINPYLDPGMEGCLINDPTPITKIGARTITYGRICGLIS